jgi:Ca-activated chloride channel family protein
VAVWVDVPRDSKESRAPAAVSVVIDTSGSMAGDKIKHAREAATKFISELRDGDMVSLHTFSDSAVERMAPMRLDSHARQRVASIISELRADGGTNLFEGVRSAGMAVMGAPSTHPVRRVVLISDGIATVGTTSREMLGTLGEKAGDRGVQLTSIGVGLDYDELTLNQLAIRSAGRLYHLTDTRGLSEILTSEINLLKSTRATNAKVAIVAAPGVELLGADGVRGNWHNGSDGRRSLEVPLGAMFAGQHREFVIRARVNAPEAGSHPIASVRLVFSDPTEGNLERVQEAVARFDVVNDPTVAMTRRNQKAHSIFAMIDSGLATERAAQMINADRFDDADKDLAVVETKLKEQARHATSKADKQRLESQASKVSQARAGAGAAAAAPPSAKPAAKRKAALEANDSAMDAMGF